MFVIPPTALMNDRPQRGSVMGVRNGEEWARAAAVPFRDDDPETAVQYRCSATPNLTLVQVTRFSRGRSGRPTYPVLRPRSDPGRYLRHRCQRCVFLGCRVAVVYDGD